ncbi:unnamed protein product [Dracunculus medinensis]|uniref:Ovule protein n=1 Tax=Dracunculus medinensis TaxID=318479 RepID=A0A0N4UH12_DRAME|nr:unnamed protein product [Dracunculus medinensis]
MDQFCASDQKEEKRRDGHVINNQTEVHSSPDNMFENANKVLVTIPIATITETNELKCSNSGNAGKSR